MSLRSVGLYAHHLVPSKSFFWWPPTASSWMLVLVTDEYARHPCGNGRVGVAGANGSFILDVKQADHGLLGAPGRQHLVKYDSVGTLGNLSQRKRKMKTGQTQDTQNSWKRQQRNKRKQKGKTHTMTEKKKGTEQNMLVCVAKRNTMAMCLPRHWHDANHTISAMFHACCPGPAREEDTLNAPWILGENHSAEPEAPPCGKKTKECARTWTNGLRLQQQLFAARTQHTLFASRQLGARPGNSALVSLRFLYSRMDLGQHLLVNL